MISPSLGQNLLHRARF